jgi:hypothetical protein
MREHTHIALKRTTVHVDEHDLAIIKETAARRGIPEAEIIQRGVHLAAMSERRWEEPLDSPTFDSGDPDFAHRVREILYGEGHEDAA